MDKRTLIFVLTLSASLFLVNLFFDYQRQEQQKEMVQQQAAKNKLQMEQLEADIGERTAAAEQLPVAEVYTSPQDREALVSGVLADGNFLTILPDGSAPEKVYGKDGREYAFTSRTDEGLVLYRADGAGALKLGHLPEFGTYELQLLAPNPESGEASYRISLGSYVDGHFSVPEEKLHELKVQMGEEAAPLPHLDAVVLIKSGGSYLPVAHYDEKGKRLVYLSEKSELPSEVSKPKEPVADGAKPEESFYVLENGTQQLVFSNYGGALAEINLPFESETNESVVKEIETDREMVEEHPGNARFPAHAYFTPGDSPSGPYIEHNKGSLGGYTPLIRRDLIESGERKSVRIPPKYYALNIVSEYPELAELVYKVKEFTQNKIIFEAVQPNRKITKTYTLSEGGAPYIFDLAINIEGDSKGLWITSGVPEAELVSGTPAPVLKYRITRAGKGEVDQIKLPEDAIVNNLTRPDWVSNSNAFFGVILDPLSEIGEGYRASFVPGAAAPTRLVEIGVDYDRYPRENFPGYMTSLPLSSKGGAMKFRIFAGPYSKPVLNAVDKIYSNPETGYNPDYSASQTFHGWFAFISEPFAKFLFLLLNFFHFITNSWGISIILLTVALRLMLYPLNAWSSRSMVKMQEIAPKVTEIQNKYKNDKKRAQLEIMNLYRESGANPLSGCFPIIIQIPFLIGMFDLLKSSFQLRGATFIPGWIDNLAAPDILFSWSTPIPLIGTEFHLLPILLGLIMFFQPRIMSPLPKDKKLWTDQQRQQRAMGTFMAIFFTWMFYNFPSGLNIYWMSSMLLGMLQQWWTQKRMKEKKARSQPKGKSRVKA